MRLAVVILIVLVACVHQYGCSVISQSSITSCDRESENEPEDDEGNKCDKKLLVTLALRGGQVYYSNAQ